MSQSSAYALPPSMRKISENLWEIPIGFKSGMRVPARIFASEKLLKQLDDAVIDQLTNVATLPGIVNAAYCMPDGHSGYGFPIGGVAAMDPESGVISPGGIGFDINCGMRLIRTNLTLAEVQPHIHKLVNRLFQRVPSGVGSSGFVNLSRREFREMIDQGARWALNRELAWSEDLDETEDRGCAVGADSNSVSEHAITRGIAQLGTLGSGNHYLEIQVAKKENIYDAEAAKVMGIDRPDQIFIMFHCGSRGFGHQVASDYLDLFLKVMESKYGINVLDRELASCPFRSPEGQAYFSAMKCAINMSFANRQVILHRIREVLSEVFGRSARDLGLQMIYDVAHNTAKLEEHWLAGKPRDLLVHRKGATRAFPPGSPLIPEKYRGVGQPVIIGGSMETGSYLLVGEKSGSQSFYSTAHGSGRTMSRHAAKRLFRGRELAAKMEEHGVFVRTDSYAGLAEEAGAAYKDIDEVVEVARQSGLSRPVVKLTPIGNIKG